MNPARGDGFAAARLGLPALALAAAGCLEGSWLWTLNPDGSGKVDVNAVVRPSPESLMRDIDAAAKRVAREVVTESSGLAAWKDVRWGVTEDGRFRFGGTAYFRDLSEVELRSGLASFDAPKPSVAKEEGRLVVGCGLPAPRPPAGPSGAGGKEGRVVYQAVRPMAAAVLPGMRWEMTIRVPGRVVETRNFEMRREGELRLVFDGRRALEGLDEVARTDPARLARWASGEERAEDALLWLGSALTGGPARAVVEGATEPLFDYEEELARAKEGYPRLIEELGAEPRAAEAEPFSAWGASGGAVVSARTDSGTGTGWTASIGSRDLEDGFWGELNVSRVVYDADPRHAEIVRVVLGSGTRTRWTEAGGGMALSFGQGDIWAMGPQVLFRAGLFGRHAELFAEVSAFAWIGERDDRFDVDAEAGASLCAAVRF